MIPQIIYIIIAITGLCLVAYRHGKPREENWNFWVELIAILIQAGIMFWGGFFDVFFK